MFKLLHRHIFRELVSLFSLIVGCLLGLILIGRMLQLREMLLTQNLGFFEIFQLFFYLSPYFLFVLTPVACLLAVFLTFLRLNSDRELVALKASGISLYQLLPAPLAFCVLCMFFSLFISLYGLSWGMDNFKSTIVEFVRTKTKLAMQPGVFNQDFPGLTFYSHKKGEEEDRMQFVFVQDERIKGVTTNIVAPKAEIKANSEKGEVRIVFNNGRIYRRDGEKLNVLSFGTYSVLLPIRLLYDYRITQDKPKEMSWALLNKLSSDPETQKSNPDLARSLRTEMQKRLALPVGCFVLGMFALPVACMFSGLKQHYGLVVSMALFLVYYAFFSLGMSLGETGIIPSFLGMWVPNLLFLGVGAYTLKMAHDEKISGVLVWVQFLLKKKAEAL